MAKTIMVPSRIKKIFISSFLVAATVFGVNMASNAAVAGETWQGPPSLFTKGCRDRAG